MNDALIKKYTPTLEGFYGIDQQGINDFRAGKISGPDLTEINKKNVATIKKIIAETGFPTITRTSKRAYKAAVLIVLHSGDVELLEQSVTTLLKADADSIERKDIGYMVDKSRIAQNRPQLYGTQYRKEANGDMHFHEIENPVDLEQRRAEMGMESFEEYKKLVFSTLSEEERKKFPH